jgi:hypothetical protein
VASTDFIAGQIVREIQTMAFRFTGQGGRYYRGTGIARTSQAATDPTAEELALIEIDETEHVVDWVWNAATHDFVPVYESEVEDGPHCASMPFPPRRHSMLSVRSPGGGVMAASGPVGLRPLPAPLQQTTPLLGR